MSEEVVDPSHPRYQSLMMRKRISEAGVKGMDHTCNIPLIK